MARGEAVHSAGEFEELYAGKTVEEHGFIGDEADATLDLEFVLRHLEAEDLDGTRVRRNKAGEHADGGGFTSSVRAKKTEEGATRDFERQSVDG